MEVIAYTEDKELKVTAIADNGTSEVARTEGNSNMSFYLPIREPRLWSPDDPFLYGLKLQLKDRKGEIIDEVSSYFGMRSVSMGKVDGVLRPLLNGVVCFPYRSFRSRLLARWRIYCSYRQGFVV